jgi:hypothetical protein
MAPLHRGVDNPCRLGPDFEVGALILIKPKGLDCGDRVLRAAVARLAEEMDTEVSISLLLCLRDKVLSGLLCLLGVGPGALSGIVELVGTSIGPPKTGLLSGEGDEKSR